MTTIATRWPSPTEVGTSSHWLKRYYFTRFAFSASWALIAAAAATKVPTLAAAMLVAYPAWDAVANYVDAQQSGGLERNQAQSLNVVVSVLTAAAVAVALGHGMHAVLFVFGTWAAFSGILQLATGVGRWKVAGAQWAMALSGIQSAVAGAFMLDLARATQPVGIANIAPYAAFGAFYFFVATVWLTVSDGLASARSAG